MKVIKTVSIIYKNEGEDNEQSVAIFEENNSALSGIRTEIVLALLRCDYKLVLKYSESLKILINLEKAGGER